MVHRVLIVDDDTELCNLVREYVGAEGFEVAAVHHGDAGLKAARTGDFDLVLLDVMLPGMSGFEILRRLRTQSDVPVLMLTARGDEVDRIVGLEIGADDYLPKPFNPRELVARIRAILRRAEQRRNPLRRARLLQVGDVELDTGTRQVRRDGQDIRVTAVEFDVLEQLLRSAGTVVSREDLTRDVLEREYSAMDRSIDMHVSNLRKKLGAMRDSVERIKTVRGIGYIYTLPATRETREADGD